MLSLNEEQVFRRATTYATSPIAKRDMAECVASPARTERESPCLLFITASVAWLNLVPGGNTARRPPLREMHSGTCGWQPPLQYLAEQSAMETLL